MKKYLFLYCMTSMFFYATDYALNNEPAESAIESLLISLNDDHVLIQPEGHFLKNIQSSFSCSISSLSSSLSSSFSSSLSSLWGLGNKPAAQESSHNAERTTPLTKKIHTMNHLLGEEQCEALFPDMELNDIRHSLRQNPDIEPAILTAFGSYADSAAQPVNDHLTQSGFVRDVLEENLTLYLNSQTKQAWFAISGTDSLADILTCIGIAGNMTSKELHDTMKVLIQDGCLPQWMSNHWLSQCASHACGAISDYVTCNVHTLALLARVALSYATNPGNLEMSSDDVILNMQTFAVSLAHFALSYSNDIALNIHTFISLAHFAFGYLILPDDFDMYASKAQTLIGGFGIIAGFVLYSNTLPILMKKWRYHGQIRQLLARIRTRRKELEDAGYKVMLSGHSLGGHLTETLGLLLGIRSFSFNAPGGAFHHALSFYNMTQHDTELRKPTVDLYQETITKIGTVGDPISAIRCTRDPVRSIMVCVENAEHNVPFIRALNCHGIKKLMDFFLGEQHLAFTTPNNPGISPSLL